MKAKDLQNKPDILCFSSTDWDGLWGSRQQVMLRFARRGYRVLFIEQLAGLEHLLRYPELRRRKRRRWREGLQPVEENLWLLSAPPMLPGRYYSTAINRINASLTAYWVKKTLEELGFQRPVLWLYKPEHGALIGKFNEVLSVYHCIDEWPAGTAGRKRRIIAMLDRGLAKKAGLVFANSPPSYELKMNLNENTHRLPSGVDAGLFIREATQPEHTAISKLPKPRIGYVGTINERLDYDFLEYLAQQRPDCSLVFVGDTYPWPPDAPQIQSLQSYKNIHFLGHYSYEELPTLIKGLDCCLIPYVNDERGRYRSPLKLYEYLAAGKPIVSTENPEVSEFSPHVQIAATPEEFVELIDKALADDNPELQEGRRQLARENSWDQRVDRMEQILNKSLRGSE